MNDKLFKDITKLIILIFFLFNFKVTINILSFLFKLILPFIIGIAIAFILNVILSKIEKIYKKILKKNKLMRPICLSLTLLLLALILIVICILIVPQVINSITIISNDLNNYINKISSCLENLGIKKSDINNVVNYIINQKEELLKYINLNKINTLDYIFGIMNKISNILFNFGVGLVFAIYILLQKEKLLLQSKKMMQAYLTKSTIEKVNKITKIANKVFSNFIGGQFLEAMILGLLCFIGMLILRIPYATVISLIVTLTALIPMFGALIGTGIGVLFIIITSPIKAITFIIYIIILQQIEGNFIYPKVVGRTVGLPGIWVVVAVTIGVSLFGLIGMIISVPIVSIIYTIINNDINSKIKLKKNS